MGGFFGLVAAADLPELHRRNQRLLTNQPGPIRYRLRRKNGELRWLLDHRPRRASRGGRHRPSRGRHAEPTSARARPQRWRSRRSRRLAALLADTLDACLLVLDVHGRVLWASDRPAEPMGAGCASRSAKPELGAAGHDMLGSWLDWLDEAAAGAAAAALPPGVARGGRRGGARGAARAARRRAGAGGGVAGPALEGQGLLGGRSARVCWTRCASLWPWSVQTCASCR